MKQTFLFLLLLCLSTQAQAARDICDSAARHAASMTAVPVDLLRAITLAETRQDGTAWPWTINHVGQGSWFSSRNEAVAAAERILQDGGAVDVGCFQINSHWHGDAFLTVDAMFDPDRNALYAAQFLSRLYAEMGDWSAAVAAYHSRDADRGTAYLDRVQEIELALSKQSERSQIRSSLSRAKRYPLFLAGDAASPGSLVPRLSGVPPLIGGP